MKKNIVHVIYPDEANIGYLLESDDTVENILEIVFAQFNAGSGMECERFINSKKRSLSVGDVVCVNGQYYLCEPFGWKQVTTEYVNKLEKAVADHPLRIQGAWFALNDVLRHAEVSP